MLVSYGASSLAPDLKARIISHLAACEFCSAELQLLTKHAPLAPARYEQAKMPMPLKYLAESLLAGSLLQMESFADPIYDKERLTLTQ